MSSKPYRWWRWVNYTTCQDCEQKLTTNKAAYPFALPFQDVARPVYSRVWPLLCPECYNRRWDRIPHGR